jgi:hypothetical protein
VEVTTDDTHKITAVPRTSFTFSRPPETARPPSEDVPEPPAVIDR